MCCRKKSCLIVQSYINKKTTAKLKTNNIYILWKWKNKKNSIAENNLKHLSIELISMKKIKQMVWYEFRKIKTRCITNVKTSTCAYILLYTINYILQDAGDIIQILNNNTKTKDKYNVLHCVTVWRTQLHPWWIILLYIFLCVLCFLINLSVLYLSVLLISLKKSILTF